MGTRVDPNLLRELKEYGAVGIEKCFNCGNCTAVCPLCQQWVSLPAECDPPWRRLARGSK